MSIYRRRTKRLFKTVDGICPYCDRPMFICEHGAISPPDGFLADQQATFEHREPQAMGGGTDGGNAMVACLRCNGDKADTPPDQYLQPNSAPLTAPVPEAGALFALRAALHG
jgi:hypothetical protein